MNRLHRKIALISGAASGIGAGIAQAFVTEGALVFVTDIADDRGQGFAVSLGASASYYHLDVRQEDDWATVIDGILENHGKLDIVVNNAGITGFEDGMAPHNPEQASLADWQRVLATNLDGTFLGCKHALRAMRPQQTGSIINMSSRSGLVGIPGAAAYAASKAAIRNHTKSVALYAAEQGWKVRCNSIHPAAILTPMWDPMLGSGPERELRMQAMVKDSPLHRFGLVEEVAAVAVLLASDEATYITGSEFNVDGGLLAGSAAPPRRPQSS